MKLKIKYPIYITFSLLTVFLLCIVFVGCDNKKAQDDSIVIFNSVPKTPVLIVTPPRVTIPPRTHSDPPPLYREPDQEILSSNKYKNQYDGYSDVKDITSGMQWADDQMLPIFSQPADDMDMIFKDYLDDEEKVSFGTLQGLVNRSKPRISIYERNKDNALWYDLLGFNNSKPEYTKETKYELAVKYKDEIKGFVLYSSEKSHHYRNLAQSIANAHDGFIPVTKSVIQELNNKNIGKDFSAAKGTIIDISGMVQTNTADIYEYLYNSPEWKNVLSKRLIINLDPSSPGKFTNRDIAAAAKAAIIYLDTKTSASGERKIFNWLLKDMADARDINNDTAVVLGFVTEEASGLGMISKYGIGLVPSDFYYDTTVFAGSDHVVYNAPVPRRPALANKVYIALYMSDGDNIQMNQRLHRDIWRTELDAKVRGNIAVNWSLAPAGADIGPGILNYYYSNMTDKEYMVAGPSGVAYFVPYCVMGGGGHSRGTNIYEKNYMDYFSKLTETYTKRTGMRIIMGSGGATAMVRSSFAQNCRSLYGYLMEDHTNLEFGLETDINTTAGVTVGDAANKLYFERSRMTYKKSVSDIRLDIRSILNKYDNKKPEFISYMMCAFFRGDVQNPPKDPNDNRKEALPSEWNTTANLIKMRDDLHRSHGVVPHEFVRADHYFSYYYEANKLPFNLTMLAEPMTRVTASDKSSADSVCDGCNRTMWETKNTSGIYLQFDFDKVYTVNRYIIKHAETTGMLKNYNTRSWKVEISTDNKKWTEVDFYQENVMAETDIDINPVDARHIRITVLDPGDQSTVRIANVEIYGYIK